MRGGGSASGASGVPGGARHAFAAGCASNCELLPCWPPDAVVLIQTSSSYICRIRGCAWLIGNCRPPHACNSAAPSPMPSIDSLHTTDDDATSARCCVSVLGTWWHSGKVRVGMCHVCSCWCCGSWFSCQEEWRSLAATKTLALQVSAKRSIESKCVECRAVAGT
jgi:hypothetical protein